MRHGQERSGRIVRMGWSELAQAVIGRRVELGHHVREAFADASGLSVRTLSDIERARRTSYDPATLARVEQALQWLPGTVDRILAEGGARASDVGEADPLLRELGAMLADDSPIPPDDRQALRTIVDRLVAPYRPQMRRRRKPAG
jgi:transcriptional regulator with XRE-family HTH domain